MSPSTAFEQENAKRRWRVYGVIILVALAQLVVGILHVRNTTTKGESPFFSANDRSRWCTVYSLVHWGTYEIDRVVDRPSSIQWDTIDKVVHVGRDGQFHQYSSKPALFSTILAGEYWLIRKTTGLNLDEHPIAVARIVLIVTNAIPFALMLFFVAGIVDRLNVPDWVRYGVVASGAWGTFLTTFSITINNHLPAAVTVAGTIYFADKILRGHARSTWSFLGAGLMGAASVASELPALALFGLVFLSLLIRAPLKTLVFFVLGSALIIGSYVGTNYLAHGLWEVPYAHRSDGPEIETWAGDYESLLNAGRLPDEFKVAMERWGTEHNQPISTAPQVTIGTWMGQGSGTLARWVIRDSLKPVQFAVVQTKPDQFSLRAWNNWYDFPGSYWNRPLEQRSWVDQGEPNRGNYALHMLVGHHGIFSLTPLWLLTLFGMLRGLGLAHYEVRWISLLTLVLTLIVFGFYLMLDVHDRNYGGQTSALRWMFWLIPLWLICLAPGFEYVGRFRLGWMVIGVLLVASILSAGYSRDNPWVHPWPTHLNE